MASDYGPEIKASQSKPAKRPSQMKKAVKESPAEEKQDVKRGIRENTPQDTRHDMMPPVQSGGGHSPAHAAMAASIAHAILGKGGM